MYDPRPDLLFLKERIDEQDERLDRLEKAVRNCLDALYKIIGECNENSKHNSE